MNKGTPYSHSRILLFHLCPYAFKRKYLDGDEAPAIATADVLIRGTTFHKIAEAANQRCIDAGEMVIMDNAVELAPDIASGLPDETYEDVLSLAAKLDSYNIIENPKTAEAEAKLSLNADWQPCDYEDEDTGFIRGRIDLFYIDGHVANVIDYKTNWRPLPESTVLQSYQLGIYALLVMAGNPDINMVKGAMDFVRVPLRHERLITRDDLPAVKTRIMADHKKISKAKKFPATTNSYCGGCKYIGRCPAFKDIDMKEQLNIKNQKQATKLAKDLLGLEAKCKTLKAELKIWIDAHEPIKVGNTYLAFNTKVSRGFDPVKAIQELMDAGITAVDLAELVSMPATKTYAGLKKVDSEKYKEIMAECGTESHRTAFDYIAEDKFIAPQDKDK